jgi:putative inorganic carbon (HCO3(-)) transporter
LSNLPNRSLDTLAILLGVLFFFLPLLYWPGFLEAASLPRYFVIGVISALGLSLWAWAAWHKSVPVVWHRSFWLILAFFSWAAISTAWSPDAGTSLIEISQLAGMIILAFLGMQMATQHRFATFLLPALLAGSLITALIGVGQHYGFNPLEFRLNEKNIAATFINRNHAAVYFDLLLPLTLVGILYFRSTSDCLLSATTAGFSIAFLLVNKSRGSLLAFVISLLVLLLILITNKPFRQHIVERLLIKRRYLTIIVIIPLLVVVLPSSSEQQTKWNASLLEQKVDYSTSLRLNAYINTLPLITQQPLTGTGFGGFRMGFRPYATSKRSNLRLTENNVMGALHNDPLQYLVELGLPGFTLALLIFFISLRTAWPSSRWSQNNPDEEILKLGLLLAIVATGIHAWVDFPLRLPSSAALFWFYLGSLLGLAAKKPQSTTISPLLQKLLLGTGLGLLLFTLGFYFNYFQGSHNLYIATARIQKNDCPGAIEAIERSFSAFSLNYVTQNRYAQIYTLCNVPIATKLQAMELILAYDPTNVRARLTRGALYLEQRNVSEAEKDLLYVVDILPHRPLAYLGLGDAAMQKHDYPAARHYYSAGLKRDPNNSYAQEMLHKLQAVN